jgi:hypothetical protein
MRTKLFFGLLGLVLLISCLLAYTLLFVWEIEYSLGLVIALVPILVFICAKFSTQIKDRRKFLSELLIILAACINYACIFFLTVIFHWEVAVFLLIVGILSFFVSLLVLNVSKSIAYVGFSVIAGAAISVLLLLSPAFAYGEMWAVNYAFESAFQPVVRLLLFAIVFAFVGSILGSFASDAF